MPNDFTATPFTGSLLDKAAAALADPDTELDADPDERLWVEPLADGPTYGPYDDEVDASEAMDRLGLTDAAYKLVWRPLNATPHTDDVTPVAGIEKLLDAIAAAEQAHAGSDCPRGQLDATAYQLIDTYRALIDALRRRPLDVDTGIGLTVAGLVIHVTADDGYLSVQANPEHLPDGQKAVFESWDRVSWQQPIE